MPSLKVLYSYLTLIATTLAVKPNSNERFDYPMVVVLFNGIEFLFNG